MTVEVLALTRYGPLGSSSRLRMLQYLPALKEAGFEVQTHAMFDDATLTARYVCGGYGTRTLMTCFTHRFAQLWLRKQFDLVWIEKEALPWWPLWLERLLLSGVPYVLDFDDAVFHHYDQHRLPMVRSIYGKRIDGLMAGAALVICGNDYLAQRARQAGARRVEILPTVIDLDRYQLTEPLSRDIPRIVWIGSPTTVKYLDMVRGPLTALAKTIPFVFRIIGGQTEVRGVKTECLPWTEATEATDLFNSDIGVMPLTDTTWERGKCGYKLIQYMACRLPVVASPVGVNSTIVHRAENGFLAADEQEWMTSLGQLLADTKLRQQMGRYGRLLVEQKYCLQVTAPKLIDMLREVAETSRLRHGKR